MRIVFLIIFFWFSQTTFAAEKIIFAVDLIRHGDRSPIAELPKADYNWSNGLGKLTAEGQLQEFLLGKALRKHYITQAHFLPEKFDPNILTIYSTNIDRTINSANALFCGLYPLSTRDKQPLLIHVSGQTDHLLTVRSENNFYAQCQYSDYNAKAWQAKTKDLQVQLKHWSDASGVELNSFGRLIRLGDILYIRKIHHVPYPAGITEADANQIIALTEWGMANKFKQNSYTSPMGRELLTTLTSYFNNAIHNKTLLKYVLLSGHDSSIMAAMNTLQVPLTSIPHYASDLSFILYANADKYYVKVTLNNQPLIIPACAGNVCSLAQLNSLF
jgi:hypothetical protein